MVLLKHFNILLKYSSLLLGFNIFKGFIYLNWNLCFRFIDIKVIVLVELFLYNSSIKT